MSKHKIIVRDKAYDQPTHYGPHREPWDNKDLGEE
jgi:hypothetical protein